MITVGRWLFASVIITIVACGEPEAPGSTPSQDDGLLTVYVVNYPLAYFAKRIGGDEIEVVFPAPADGDPAYWSPEPEIIAEYQAAGLIVLNGADYAKWTKRATLPASRVVDTSVGFREQHIPLADVVTHSHGPSGQHAHTGVAFTTWLDPMLAIEQAEAIAVALSAARPEQTETFERGFEALTADLTVLDRRLRTISNELGDEPVLFSHPVYQYLERACDINGRSVHWEPDEPPDERLWRELEGVLREHPARLMIWEDEPLEETIARLEALGVESVVYTPVANRPDLGDFLSAMSDNIARLETVARGRNQNQ